jgi:hypothetical protein
MPDQGYCKPCACHQRATGDGHNIGSTRWHRASHVQQSVARTDIPCHTRSGCTVHTSEMRDRLSGSTTLDGMPGLVAAPVKPAAETRIPCRQALIVPDAGSCSMTLTGQVHSRKIPLRTINLPGPGSSIRCPAGQATHPSEKQGLSCRYRVYLAGQR